MTDIAAELHANGIWRPIEIELALKMPKTRRMRCPECHGRIRAHKAGKDGQKAHMEHYERHAGCSRGDCFKGSPLPIHARSFEAMSRLMSAHPLVFAAAMMVIAQPAFAQDDEDFDPADVSIVDAINCHLDAPTYNGFALSVGGDEGEAHRRHWRKVATGNAFLDEYELPEPIAVTGAYSTRRIAFSSTGVMAILDLADPAPLAKAEGIANAADPEPLIAEIVASGKATRAEIEADMPFRKFLGEQVMVDVTELPPAGESFGAHTIIARTISNVSTHPGKTLYGCSYRIELIDKEGRPL